MTWMKYSDKKIIWKYERSNVFSPHLHHYVRLPHEVLNSMYHHILSVPTMFARVKRCPLSFQSEQLTHTIDPQNSN